MYHNNSSKIAGAAELHLISVEVKLAMRNTCKTSNRHHTAAIVVIMYPRFFDSNLRLQ